MSKHTTTNMPAPRVIHYIDPAATTHEDLTDLLLYTAAELAARQRREQILYTRWVKRQAAIAEHDRRARRFMLGLGITLAVGILAALAVVGWLAYHAITTAAANAGSWIGGLIIGALVFGGAVVGGCRCVTIIEHRH